MLGCSKLGSVTLLPSFLTYLGRSEAPLEGPASAVLSCLGIGRITFLGDYLWVQRDADGVLLDVWMRAPDDAGDGELGEK